MRKTGSLIRASVQAFSLFGLLISLHFSYADDANGYCLARAHEPAERGIATFMHGNTSIGCDALPSGPSSFDFNQQCKILAASDVPNCSVHYYSDTPADTVLFCSAKGTSPPYPIFKYVLCADPKHADYTWALFDNYDDKIWHAPGTIPQNK